MSLPRQLIKSYDAITHSTLVEKNIVNVQSIKEFAEELNKAIPEKTNILAYTVYKFNRNKYLSNKKKFIKDITNTPYYKFMILWTDYEDILNYFDLHGKIFLGWDRYFNKYNVHMSKRLQKEENNGTENELNQYCILKNSSPSTNSISSAEEQQPENENEKNMVDDQDKLFDYMNSKRKKLIQVLMLNANN